MDLNQELIMNLLFYKPQVAWLVCNLKDVSNMMIMILETSTPIRNGTNKTYSPNDIAFCDMLNLSSLGLIHGKLSITIW